MPELPEAETVRRTLAPALLGRTIVAVRVSLAKLCHPGPAELKQGLLGRTLAASRRHGKLIIFELTGGGFFTIHLGMTGQTIVAPVRPAARHLHVTIAFADRGPRFYYRDPRQFGGRSYCPDEAALKAGPLRNFGPDALAIGEKAFVAALRRRGAPLKSLLLDQRILAGVGNIYADEALFRAGLSPLARPRELSPARLARLFREIQGVLAEALAQGGSSVKNFVDANGRAGTFQEAHRVYRRGGEPCPVCGAPIQRTVLGGRATHFCPVCQGEGC